MKKILLLGLAILSCTGLFAQIVCNEKSMSGSTPEIKTTTGKDKNLVNLYSITLPYSADEIKEAIHTRLETEDIEGSKTKNNFYAFKGVQYSYLWDKTCDIYIAITGNKNSGSINLLISQGYDNYIDPYKDPITTQKAFKWLIAADKVVYDYIYEQNLATHAEELKDIEKELSKLEKKHNSLESKIKKTKKKQLKLEASKTVFSENDLNVDSKQIAAEQKEAAKLQKDLDELYYELKVLDNKIDQTKGDLNTKKNTIQELKKNKK